MIWTHPLFHESVRLLLNHPEIEWSGATSDVAGARDQVFSLRPDTILVEQVGEGVPVEVIELLEACSWDVRLIGFSLADNQLSVYHRERKTVAQSDELLHLVLNH